MSIPGAGIIDTLDELETTARARGLRIVRVALEPAAVRELHRELIAVELSPVRVTSALLEGGFFGYWNGIALEAAPR